MIGRNQPCPCGSGRKYKHCCGAPAGASRAAHAATGSLSHASQLLQGGKLAQAERVYRQILEREPSNPDALHFLGMCLVQMGRHGEALTALQRSVELVPANEGYWRNLGIVLLQLNDLPGAEASLRRAAAVKPDSATAHNYLAVAMLRTGRFDDAVQAFERALALNPADDTVHNNFGYALLEHGEVERSRDRFRRAIELNPRNAMAHNNLGNALHALGDVPGSLASYRRAVEMEPGFPLPRFNLGRMLVDAGQPEAALEHLHAAARLAPAAAATWQWLVDVLAQFRFDTYKPEIEAELVECFSRPDIDPAYLAQAAASLLRADARFRAVLLSAGGDAGALPLEDAVLGQLARPLFMLMLEKALIPEPYMEDLVARVRRAALLAREAGSLCGAAPLRDVLAALAHQCFLCEYLHAEGVDESQMLDRLRAELEQVLARGGKPSEEDLALFACYRPLHELVGAIAAQASANSIFGRLFLRQVAEPAEEARIGSELPALTVIGNEVSRTVRGQYEAHPYPRWIHAPSTGGAFPLALRLRTLFPRSVAATDVPERPSILIAGCGTGRHVAITSMLNPASRILALDLSRASLAYAARRARELGLQNVEFAQADILELGGLDRCFDVIECSGVLHHMQDPVAGWRVLAGRLNPGGRMKVGLYSEIGRRSVVAAKKLIARQGYAADVQGMRAARAAILALPSGDAARAVGDLLDFYSLSGCRDLLFHVQERRYSLGEVEALVAALGLDFLGFEFETRSTLLDYQREFPDDPAAVSIGNWAQYELRHPDTFAGMYQFWVASRK